jgi:thiamine monophosphate synthase
MWRLPIRVSVASVAVISALMTRRDPQNTFWTAIGKLTLESLDAETAFVI